MKYSIEELKEFLKPLISEKRYNHSVMVMEEAKEYLKKYGNNDREFYEKTIRAALMHDMAKEMTQEEIKEYDFDEEMANSIRWHTTGSTNMSLMDKIVFLADKTGRENLLPTLKKVREKAFIDLDEAIYYYIEENIKRLKEKNATINQKSIETKNYFFKKLNKIAKF